MDLKDLLELEKATRIIVQRYENTIKNYDGTINDDTASFEKFSKYNKIYTKVLEDIEKKIVEKVK